jgi:hypothetical protein
MPTFNSLYVISMLVTLMTTLINVNTGAILRCIIEWEMFLLLVNRFFRIIDFIEGYAYKKKRWLSIVNGEGSIDVRF